MKDQFFKDPFKSAKDVIKPKVKSKPKVSKSVLNEYIQKVASDPKRIVSLGELDGLDDILMNIGKFNSEKFKISELSQIFLKRRKASWPGPNQIPYKVYMKCPRVMNCLFRIMLIAVRDKVFPLNWHISNWLMIPKTQN